MARVSRDRLSARKRENVEGEKEREREAHATAEIKKR